MKNRGFVTISMILFLPIILLIVLTGLWTLWFINGKNSVENLCHHHLLRAQDAIISGNQKVLNLNSIAKTLIERKRQLNAVIALAPPQAKAAALLEKQLVVAMQFVLATQQKSLFATSHWRAQREFFTFRKKFQNEMHLWKKFWRSRLHVAFPLEIDFLGTQLEINEKDIASTYRRSNRHETRQRMSASWRISIRKMLPYWLKKIVPVPHHWNGQCFSHPHDGGQQWTSNIGRGNHSLKPSLSVSF